MGELVLFVHQTSSKPNCSNDLIQTAKKSREDLSQLLDKIAREKGPIEGNVKFSTTASSDLCYTLVALTPLTPRAFYPVGFQDQLGPNTTVKWGD